MLSSLNLMLLQRNAFYNIDKNNPSPNIIKYNSFFFEIKASLDKNLRKKMVTCSWH